MTYQPPFQLTNALLTRAAQIAELVGAWKAANPQALLPKLRRENRIRTIQASLAIEQNTLTLEQVTAVLEGKTVLGPPKEIQEVRNAFAAYEAMEGADAAERNIRIAELHAAQSGLSIDYRATTAEALAAAGERFDVVLNMEVVEHVDNVPLYMQSCAELVAPGGLLFTATINRTPRAWALAIVGAEQVLRWLPKGTHDYRRFLTPDEITALVERHGLRVTDRSGVAYHPLAGEWRLSRDLGVNYMVLAEKPAA